MRLLVYLACYKGHACNMSGSISDFAQRGGGAHPTLQAYKLADRDVAQIPRLSRFAFEVLSALSQGKRRQPPKLSFMLRNL